MNGRSLPDLSLPPVTLSFLRSLAYRSTWISLDSALHYVRFILWLLLIVMCPIQCLHRLLQRRLLPLDLLHRLLIAHACAAPNGWVVYCLHLFYLFNVGVYSVQVLLGAMPAVVFSAFYIRLFATSAVFGVGGAEDSFFFFFSSFEASYSIASIFSTFRPKYRMFLLLVATYLTHTLEITI